jgi:hypothetical protein
VSTLIDNLVSPEYGETLDRICRRLDTHPATLTRWILKGRRLRDGSFRKLPATRFPGGWRVRPADLDAFLADLTADRLGAPDQPAPRSPAECRQGYERAEAALDADKF